MNLSRRSNGLSQEGQLKNGPESTCLPLNFRPTEEVEIENMEKPPASKTDISEPVCCHADDEKANHDEFELSSFRLESPATDFASNAACCRTSIRESNLSFPSEQGHPEGGVHVDCRH